MNKRKKIRLISQIFFFALVGLISLNHYLVETGSTIPFIGSASLHAICPYGGVETFVALIQYGVFVKKIHTSSLVITSIILVLAVIVGPVVCSYMCPLGSIQEWIGRIGKKIFGKRYNTFVPRKVDEILRFARYFVLIFTVYVTTNSLRLLFLEIDPYYALFNFWTGEATIGGIIVLLIILISTLFIERPWCKYACPFGALVGISNLFSIFKIKRNNGTCINCKKCDLVCPMNIQVSATEVVKDHQCIRCGECTSEVLCPIDNTVELRIQSFKEGK
ncbi:4Fe-4S binding protein [Clostridium grantii]|uniref:4Fe-4S binding domain-containing protein n=1 Tax=Clostridium grantii DSM 8605 TaxID=1121316 RepID=A0A1M5VMX8_9CLOT|nr:4Fe-4S binding protein [Clostridium grantii]SHH76283.1 4Fe-4S binding domain-containing protein [Clostridium grantii DSM 8605]